MLNDFNHEFNHDIIALTETWLNEYSEYIIPQITNNIYNFKHIPRQELRRGGGVGILYKKSLKLTSFTKYILPGSECIIAIFNIHSNKIIRFIIIYRPPSNNYISFQ